VARMKRKFSPQFKAEAVQFAIETGRPIAEIARELEKSGRYRGEKRFGRPPEGREISPKHRKARTADCMARMIPSQNTRSASPFCTPCTPTLHPRGR
jgi:transposase-like protein